MVRTILKPENQTVTIDIPQSYIGKEIEVIAFAKDEGMSDEQPAVKKVTFTALSIDTKEYKFNRDEANER